MKSIFRFATGGMVLLLAMGMSCQELLAEPAPIPFHNEAYVMQSGAHADTEAQTAAEFSQTIQVSGAAWLQLHFGDYDLGSKSYIRITSVLDGGVQTLDGRTLPVWGNSSAYFNGDAVVLELYVAPGDEGVYIQTDEISVGEPPLPGPEPQEICGSTDDRVSSNDAAVGRIMPAGCTGWLISNGAGLTAGHCVGTNHSIQFNVPSSLSDGTPVNPPPEDQYPITYTDSRSNGVGDDWAVFSIAANSDGDTVVDRQNDFFRMSIDLSPTTVRETGFGIDGPAPLFGDGVRNADSQTQQTHAGPFVDETIYSSTVVRIRFQIDDENGNSGSPVMDTANGVTIGIATAAGCTATGGSNNGTGFENDGLETAIRDFTGTNVRFVDVSHPVAVENGTVFRPYNTVAEAVAAVPTGGIVSIVAGTYSAAAGNTITITKSMTLEAPVGSVYIGN